MKHLLYRVWIRFKAAVLVLVGAGILSCPLATGQNTLQDKQDKMPRLTFEVASIHLSKPGTRDGAIKALPGSTGYTSQNIPVKLIMSLMYKVPMRQILGAPEWMNSDGYDIAAKADGVYSVDDLHTMFQNLLADRFALKFHKETKEGNVYALVQEKAGSKMTVSPHVDRTNIPVLYSGFGSVVGTGVDLQYLCWWLGQQLQHDERPVIDMTGLDRKQFYDFKLEFMPNLPPDFPKENLPAGAQDLPSIFDAVREQLGLKLVAQKGPVEYYVIDHVERPSDN
jgi:uncharacterized protein (TIGR03435 family)